MSYTGSNPVPSTMKQDIVITQQILSQNPLFWSGQGPIAVKTSHPNIFLGTGIATPTQLSRAVPFDTLSFLLSAEFIKRKIPKAQVFLFIADQHAWLANNFDIAKSKKITQLQLKTFTQIISSLKLKDWHIFLASQLFPNTKPASYETLETRDVTHFIRNHQIGIKIGWKFSDSHHKTDEAHFDEGLNITSLFTKPGVTSDPHKPQESPYICTNSTTRILLSSHTRCVIDNQAVQNQLKRITMLFEKLMGAFPPKTPLVKQLDIIINKIFN